MVQKDYLTAICEWKDKVEILGRAKTCRWDKLLLQMAHIPSHEAWPTLSHNELIILETVQYHLR
jgi:hypothetical protein